MRLPARRCRRKLRGWRRYRQVGRAGEGLVQQGGTCLSASADRPPSPLPACRAEAQQREGAGGRRAGGGAAGEQTLRHRTAARRCPAAPSLLPLPLRSPSPPAPSCNAWTWRRAATRPSWRAACCRRSRSTRPTCSRSKVGAWVLALLRVQLALPGMLCPHPNTCIMCC